MAETNSNKLAEFFQSLATIAAGRHYVTAMLSIFTVIGIFVNIPAAQQTEIMNQLAALSDGLQQTFGAIAKLIPLITGIAMAVIATISGLSASLKGRMKSLDQEAKAGAGIKIITAEGSKAAEIAAKLPGNETEVVSANQPVTVVVPPAAPAASADPVVSAGKPPLVSILLVCLLVLPLSGCKSIEEYMNDLRQLVKVANDGLDKAKDSAKKICAAIDTEAQTAAAIAASFPPGKACKSKDVTAGIAASVRTACQSIDRATVTSIVRIIRGLTDSYKAAANAKDAGC